MKNLILSLTLLISANFVNACSWWPEGDYIRFSLFSSDLAGGDDMSELFYSASLFNDYLVDDYKGPSENLNEWYTYFEGQFTVAEISELIYTSPKTGLEHNKLLQHFKEGGHPEAAEYVMFSKELEENLDWNQWDKEMDIVGIEKSIDIARGKVDRVQDQEIKMRYVYQLIVANYYLNNYKAVRHYHKDVLMKFPQESVIKVWGQFFYANTLDRDEKLYNLAIVFDESKSKNRFIFQRFPRSRNEVKGVLALCKTDAEKAAVLSILAFKNPGRALDQVVEVAQLNPNNELVDILLIREINKMEDWYLTEKYTDYGPAINTWDDEKFGFIKEKNFESDKAYLKEFKAAMEKVFTEKKIKNRALWYTCLAYMSYMLDDASETTKFIDLANKNAKTNEIKGQLAIIEVLHLMKHETTWNESFQQNLMLGVEKVEQFEKDIYKYERFHAQMMLAVSRKYLEQDDLVLACLFESKVSGTYVFEPYAAWGDDQQGYQAFNLLNVQGSAKDLEKLFEFWDKPEKTVLEQWLMEDMIPFKWKFMDLWGTMYFRDDKLTEALKIYEQIPDSVWTQDNGRLHYYYSSELKNDPFETNIYGRGYGANMGKTYTKPEFIKEILRLKGMLEGPVKDKAYYALLLGNAYYNMTQHGNSYYYTEYSWGYVYGSYYLPESEQEKAYYYNAERALKYYELAESLAPNRDYAAFCYRLQLKCKKNSYWYNQEEYDDYKKVKLKQIEDWKLFAAKYPAHYKKLTNCDHYLHYSNAWQEG